MVIIICRAMSDPLKIFAIRTRQKKDGEIRCGFTPDLFPFQPCAKTVKSHVLCLRACFWLIDRSKREHAFGRLVGAQSKTEPFFPNQPHRWPGHGTRAPPPHPTPESEMSTRTSSPVLVSSLVFHSHGAVAIQLPDSLQPGRWRLGAAHGRWCPPHRPRDGATQQELL